MNNVVLIGRLARDVELSYTPNTQTAIARFTLAVDRPRREGEDQGADFIRIVVWGKQAENCDKYLSKGRQAAVRGRITTGSYKNKNGETVYTTDVTAENVEFLGGGSGNGQTQGGGARAARPAQQAAPAQEDFGGFEDLPDSFQAAEDDIPF